jgi:hypothetical protein
MPASLFLDKPDRRPYGQALASASRRNDTELPRYLFTSADHSKSLSCAKDRMGGRSTPRRASPAQDPRMPGYDHAAAHYIAERIVLNGFPGAMGLVCQE